MMLRTLRRGQSWLPLVAFAGCTATDARESASAMGSSGVAGESGGALTGPATSTSSPVTSSGLPPTSSSGGAAATSSGPQPETGKTGSSTTDQRPLEPMLEVWPVTANNRAHVEMHGGWGPHLRAPMTASDGSLWFAYDGGPSVSSNTTIHYAHFDGARWADVAQQSHINGVQQNAAHVLRNDVLFSYAVSPGSSQLEECFLDTSNPVSRGCNVIAIGGAYATPPNSNYVGAALDPSGAKIVWFTVVGSAGATGQFIYTYNFGGGWNGPVLNTLPGYNDFAYVRAFTPRANTVEWVGQAYIGDFPNGSFAVGADTVALGSQPAFQTLGPPAAPDISVRQAGDVWIDPSTGDSHALARAGNATYYFHKPAAEQWSAHTDPDEVLDGIVQTRWLHAQGQPLMMLARGAGPLRALWLGGGATQWATAEELPIDIPARGFESPSAIYSAGPEYQTEAVTSLDFAVCGQYQVSDEQIWHGRISWQ